MKNYFSSLKSSFYFSVKNNKIEIITSIITLLFMLYVLINPERGMLSDVSKNIEKFFLIGLIIENLLNIDNKRFRPLYYLSFIPYLLLIFFCSSLKFDSVFDLYLIFGLLYLSSPFLKNNEDFSANLFKRLTSFLISIFLAFIIGVTIMLVFNSITMLFNIKVANRTLVDSIFFSLSAYGFAPIIYFSVSKMNEELTFIRQSFFKIILNYILTPTLIVYTVVFYCYIIRILIIGELPKGMLANMTLAFVCVAIAGKIYCLISEHKFAWFYDKLHIICIPVLALFTISVYERIVNYGFTNDRILLISFGILILLFCVLFFFKNQTQWRSLSIIAIILLTISFLFTFVTEKNMESWYKGKNAGKVLARSDNIARVTSENNVINNIGDFKSVIIVSPSYEASSQDNNCIYFNYYNRTGELILYKSSECNEIGVYKIMPLLDERFKDRVLNLYKEKKNVYNISLPDSLFRFELSPDTTAVFNCIEYSINQNDISKTIVRSIDKCTLLVK